jgi:hypothetical protein
MSPPVFAAEAATPERIAVRLAERCSVRVSTVLRFRCGRGSRECLFGLKIASSDTDRETSARQYLAATSNISTADRQSDTSLQALTQLAQSIVARIKSQPGSAFLSTFS